MSFRFRNLQDQENVKTQPETIYWAKWKKDQYGSFPSINKVREASTLKKYKLSF